MEYVFGTKKYDGQVIEVCKTEGEEYTNLSGFVNYIFASPSARINHTFRIIRKYREEIDLRGLHCTWYLIDNHTKDIDRTGPIMDNLTNHDQRIESNSTAIDDILISILEG
ncbi:MAG: hypothetical protein IKL08_00480 [Clostridia bacterium]|nr:hypothetical protein [Clostridia bacterium]